ncbi:U1 snRNP protein [Basidiobolus ranarum]|uniref:U1 snRNP protein n=1 Tax=Basidiobolus ranarum TaxID=34480 RepID=A0ABR2WB74_9FUNG
MSWASSDNLQMAKEDHVPSTVTQINPAWSEHLMPDGRTYYYNSVTKQSLWEKPAELSGDSEKKPKNDVWKEYLTKEGKKYYYNTETKVTTWEAPSELKAQEKNTASTISPNVSSIQNSATVTTPQTSDPSTPVSAPIANSGSTLWKEYTTEDGRKYYHNSATKVTTWEMPAEFKESTEMSASRPSPKSTSLEIARASPVPAKVSTPPTASKTAPSKPVPIISNISIDFKTKEEAETAFFKLLKDTGVTSTWSWEQTMRAIISHPIYRSLKTLAERKQTFQKYVQERRKIEEEEYKVRTLKNRGDFLLMLQKHPEITSAIRWRKAAEMLRQDATFQHIRDEKEMRGYYEDYIYEVKKREKDQERIKRKEGMERFAQLLEEIPEITRETRWKDAQSIFRASPEFQEIAWEAMDALDFLAVFEEHIKKLEDEYIDKRKREKEARIRTERKNRDAVRELIDSSIKSGQITARSRWQDFYPLIKDHAFFINMLGQPGSTPLELFWDAIEILDEKMYQKRKCVNDILKEKNITVTPDDTLDSFIDVLKDHEQVSNISEEEMKIIFEQIHKKAVSRQKEEQRKEQKRRRRIADDFKYFLKHLKPQITTDTKWDEIRSSIEGSEEFNAVESEEERLHIFQKVLDRLKEKEKDRGEESEEGTVKAEEGELEDKDSSRKRKHKKDRKKKHHKSRRHRYESDASDSDDERRKHKKKKSKRDDDAMSTSSIEEGEARDEDYDSQHRSHRKSHHESHSRSRKTRDYYDD